ncbi:MAG: tRNA (adenosine(37)-N6)-dimethylallyltransferase MiaA [Myxococcales bacterium]|nr:MAG: tRNA (adenosine(37)-N6)-dimethylallyltransferase MiaA [Myxococcales bacterium]
MPRTPVIAVVGATAAGKSDLALGLAERLGGEVVNTDAMQVYRGMDIGTAKLPVPERRGVTHHLLDFLDVTETASVAEFQRMARSVIEDLRGAGKTPVLVGGSALYTRAIVDVFEFPGTDPVLRSALEAELAEVGSASLHQRLAAKDPAAAAAILPSNGRRIVRALEVIELTGSFTAELPEPAYALDDVVQLGVDIDRPTVDERIARRVDLMWEQGLVDEVRGLRPGIDEGLTASRAIGYKQVLMQLDGVITEEQAREQTTSATRRFSRRQDSWFRNDPRVRWVPWDDPLDQALEAIG